MKPRNKVRKPLPVRLPGAQNNPEPGNGPDEEGGQMAGNEGGDATSSGTTPQNTASNATPKARPSARDRVPIGQQSRLKYPQRPGYHRRIVNDVQDGERIRAFEAAGYTMVKGSLPGGDDRAGADSQMGNVVSRSVGGGVKAFLMEIPLNYYNADQIEKQKKIDKNEEGLRRGPAIDNRFGEVKIG